MINIREIDHVVLRVKDIETMSRFYCDVLGAPVGKTMPRFCAEGNGVSIYLTDPEGNVVELKGPSDGSSMPPPDAAQSK